MSQTQTNHDHEREAGECLVCESRTDRTIIISEADAEQVHLCRDCWDAHLEERVTVPLMEAGVYSTEAIASLIEQFYKHTERSDHWVEYGAPLPDYALPTTIRRSDPVTLGEFSVGPDGDGGVLSRDIRWRTDKEYRQEAVLGLVVFIPLGGDYPVYGATLFVGDDVEDIHAGIGDTYPDWEGV